MTPWVVHCLVACAGSTCHLPLRGAPGSGLEAGEKGGGVAQSPPRPTTTFILQPRPGSISWAFSVPWSTCSRNLASEHGSPEGFWERNGAVRVNSGLAWQGEGRGRRSQRIQGRERPPSSPIPFWEWNRPSQQMGNGPSQFLC